MSRELSLTDEAIEDLEAMRNWQTQPGSGEAARRRARAILTAIQELRDFPCRYPRAAQAGLRRRVVQRHIVVYRVVPDTGDNQTAGAVQVIRVLGPGQQG